MSQTFCRPWLLPALVGLGIVASRFSSEHADGQPGRDVLPVQYELVWIGDLGGRNSRACALNDWGDVVGWANDRNGLTRAFLNIEVPAAGARRLIDLNELLDDWRRRHPEIRWRSLLHAYDVTDNRVIVGRGQYAVEAAGSGRDKELLRCRAFRLEMASDQFGALVIRSLSDAGPNLSGEMVSFAAASSDVPLHCINTLPGGVQHYAYEFRAGGRMQTLVRCGDGPIIDLGMLGDAAGMRANAVNRHGQIVGASVAADGDDYRAWRYTPAEDSAESGKLEDLGTLNGLSWAASLAADVNDLGLVVGHSSIETGDRRAIAYSDRGGMIALGTLGGRESCALGVNNKGLAVGWSETAAGEKHGFVYLPDRGLVDLVQAVVNIDAETAARLRPRRINAAGQICGTLDPYTPDGGKIAGCYAAFLLTPLPALAQ